MLLDRIIIILKEKITFKVKFTKVKITEEVKFTKWIILVNV